MRLSVCMSVFNNAPFLDQAVESILGQSMTAFEFVIIDDGSTDGSTAILRRHAARDPRIRLIEQENCGLVPSLNRAVDTARAPWIARMDGDDVALPDRFARQIAFLEAHPDHAAVGCQLELIDEAGATLRTAVEYPLTPDAFVAALEHRPSLSHPAAMLSRDAILVVGGYRALYRHCEDYDLWLRLAERYPMANLDAILLRYRHNPDQVSQRHLLQQKTGAAIAWEAYRERLAGGPDPLAAYDVLPPIADLDRVFGRTGVAARVRAKVTDEILYDAPALAGAVPLLIAHARDGGERGRLWRAALRLARHDQPGAGARLAAGLVGAGFVRAGQHG